MLLLTYDRPNARRPQRKVQCLLLSASVRRFVQLTGTHGRSDFYGQPALQYLSGDHQVQLKVDALGDVSTSLSFLGRSRRNGVSPTRGDVELGLQVY